MCHDLKRINIWKYPQAYLVDLQLCIRHSLPIHSIVSADILEINVDRAWVLTWPLGQGSTQLLYWSHILGQSESRKTIVCYATLLTPSIPEIIRVKNVRAIVVCGFLMKSLKKHILKIWKKSWVPFGSYLIDSTANPAHFHSNWAGLALLFSRWLPRFL